MTPLKTLMLGELSERFCYWGLQSFLVLYLVEAAGFTLSKSIGIQGLFTANAYFSCILGGLIADRLLGAKATLGLGALLITVGSLLVSVQTAYGIYLGLAAISCGNGFFQPNCTTLLGGLRGRGCHYGENNFISLYMVMNIGAVLGPLCCGVMIVSFGWRTAILMNAVIMAPWGLIIFNMPSKIINHSAQTRIGYASDNYKTSASSILFVFSLMLLCVIFFACYFQIENSLLTLSKSHINTDLFGYSIPVTAIAGLEPLCVIACAPVVSYLSITNPIKLWLGFFLAALGFMFFAYAAEFAMTHEVKAPLPWILLGCLFLGAGEITFMPTVLSAVTQHSPQASKNIFTGIFFSCLATASYFASVLAKMTGGDTLKVSDDALNYYALYKNISLFLLTTSIMILFLVRHFRNKSTPLVLKVTAST